MKKTIKLTPEQEAEQNRIRAEREAQRVAEAAEAKIKRNREVAEALKFLTDQATVLKQFKAADASEAARREEYVRSDIGHKWLRIQEELIECTYDFALRPAKYFEWAESSMKLACEREMLDQIIYRLAEGKCSLKEVISDSKNDLTEKILQNYDRPSSTSAAHNATMINKSEARSSFLRYTLNGWLSTLNKVS